MLSGAEVFEHSKDHSLQWATVESITDKIACTTRAASN